MSHSISGSCSPDATHDISSTGKRLLQGNDKSTESAKLGQHREFKESLSLLRTNRRLQNLRNRRRGGKFSRLKRSSRCKFVRPSVRPFASSPPPTALMHLPKIFRTSSLCMLFSGTCWAAMHRNVYLVPGKQIKVLLSLIGRGWQRKLLNKVLNRQIPAREC